MTQAIKDLRKQLGITQAQAAKLVEIPLRTYVNYENDESKKDTIKYNYIVRQLKQAAIIDETHGVLSLEDIISKCENVFKNQAVHYCYLFGSYAKGCAKPTSDVDLLISTDIKGLKFFGLIEELRNELGKKVDLLTTDQLNDNMDLLENILKEGFKIYGENKSILPK